ncbi:putative Golgi SNAP receptor complex member 1-like protein [Naja naja]|nr:putative Golgi SNAP receptor complex member 1-like protein [Naja naja]
MAAATAAGSSNYWEDLRKQARQLENELDLKLVSFSKLCISYSHGSSRDGRRDRSYKSGCGVNNRRTELFLKENEHLRK